MTLGERGDRPGIATGTTHEVEAVALALDRLHQLLAPPAEADDASVDHAVRRTFQKITKPSGTPVMFWRKAVGWRLEPSDQYGTLSNA